MTDSESPAFTPLAYSISVLHAQLAERVGRVQRSRLFGPILMPLVEKMQPMYDEKVAPIIGQYAQPIVNQYVQQVDAQLDAIRKQYGAEKQAFVKKVDSLKAINVRPQELWDVATNYVHMHKPMSATDFIAGLKPRLGSAYNEKLEPSLVELFGTFNEIKGAAQKDIAIARLAIEKSKQVVEEKYNALLGASQERFDRLVPIVQESSSDRKFVSDPSPAAVSLTIVNLVQHMHARLRDQAVFQAHQMKSHAQIRASELKVQTQLRASQLKMNSISSVQASYQLAKQFSAVNICHTVGVDPIAAAEKLVSRHAVSFAAFQQHFASALEHAHAALYSRFSSAHASMHEKSSPLILQAKSTLATATDKVNDMKITLESSTSSMRPSLSHLASLQEIQSRLFDLQQALRSVGVSGRLIAPIL